MKKLFIIAMAMTMALGSCFAQASEQKEIRKERQEIRKLAKKELTAKVNKVSRKEAKRLKKEGWNIKPGALPLDKQLEKSYYMLQYRLQSLILQARFRQKLQHW